MMQNIYLICMTTYSYIAEIKLIGVQIFLIAPMS